MRYKSIARLVLVAFAASFVLSSCLKRDYERPPDTSMYDPMLTVTHTIAQLKAMNDKFDYRTGGDTTLINSEIVISGIVIADDRSGNFYKQIVIQDETGGLQVNIDAYSLYNDYPVGRKIYLRCKGLMLGYNAGTPQIGYGVDEQASVLGIPGGRVGEFIVKADVGHALKDTVITLPQAMNASLSSANTQFLLNRLVTIRDVQFRDTGKAYTQPNGATNRMIEPCSGSTDSLAVRSSNYASFAALPVPAGSGSITGIYTVFTSSTSGRTTPQLLFRDSTDVSFNIERCISGGSNAGNAMLVSIDTLRRLYIGGTLVITLGNIKIRGVVISDRSKSNIDSKNVIIQQGNRGIMVRFTANHTLNLKDSVEISLNGRTLEQYQNLLQVNNVTTSRITKLGTGNISPLTLTIADLTGSSFESYESTLVRIANVTASSTGTYGGSRNITDGAGTITLFTYNTSTTTASFANDPIFAGTKTLTGIVSQYASTKQLQLRNLNDVQ